VDARTGSWPSFGRAFVRFLIKTILGVISFFTMELSRRHQAVHDLLTHTTVHVVAESEEVRPVAFAIGRDPADVVLLRR
jgi:uncharacterized RDD family membrane protein YckC